jgi:hypothetical protein
MQTKNLFPAFLSGILVLSAAFCFAQSTQKAAFVGAYTGVGLDYRWRNAKGSPDFSVAANLGSFLLNGNGVIGCSGKMLLGKKHSFVTGINFMNTNTHGAYVSDNTLPNVEPVFSESFGSQQLLALQVGYRFQPKNQRFFGEILLAPLGLEFSKGKLNTNPYTGFLGQPPFELRLGINIDRLDDDGKPTNPSAYFDADSSKTVSIQHSIYLSTPILLGCDARVHGLWQHDLAFTVNGFHSFAGDAAYANANIAATMLLGKGIVPFEIGLNMAYIRRPIQVQLNAFSPFGSGSDIHDFIFVPVENLTLGLPIGFRYQSAKGGLFLKMTATPFLYLNPQKTYSVNKYDNLRCFEYGNDLSSQVMMQVAVGYSFGK